ncbi:MAG: hypothetical protein LAP13_12720 [Acidobacteriia bacterium]|nr:hypothetical protein [Terriglobia bacterium]
MDDSIHNQGTSRREALKKLALGPGAKIDGRSLSLHGKPFVKLSAAFQTTHDSYSALSLSRTSGFMQKSRIEMG